MNRWRDRTGLQEERTMEEGRVEGNCGDENKCRKKAKACQE